jgi:Zn-dependent protease
MSPETAAWLEPLLLHAPIILLALTVHEFAHAYAAVRLGDDTPEREGRVTLSPAAHLDPLGTLMLFLPGSLLGWARPVNINPANFSNPRRDDIIVTAAGPLSNLAQAVVFALLIHAMSLTGWLPLPYTFEPIGPGRDGRARVEYRNVSTGETGIASVGDPLGRSRFWVGKLEPGDASSGPVLLLNPAWGWERGGSAGAATVIRLPQRSDTAQRTLHVVGQMLIFGVMVNLSLFLFNLIPLYPLDGHHIARNLLPYPTNIRFQEWQATYGTMVLIGLLLLSRAQPMYSPTYWIVGVGSRLMGQALGGETMAVWLSVL